MNAFLDINPIIAERNARHANDKPNGINTWATRTKPKGLFDDKILRREKFTLTWRIIFPQCTSKII